MYVFDRNTHSAFTNLGCSGGRDLRCLHAGGRAGVHNGSSVGQIDGSHGETAGLVLQDQRAVLFSRMLSNFIIA